MTRLWLLARGFADESRTTADVDLAIAPELLATNMISDLLLSSGYVRDAEGYPFRYSKSTADGVRIVDLLSDPTDSTSVPTQRTYGLAFATGELAAFDLDISGHTRISVRTPTLARAFVLRTLALSDGPSGLKFGDYVDDAVRLAELIDRDDAGAAQALTDVLDRTEVQEAARITERFFGEPTAPGSVAAARRRSGDAALRARQASSLMRALLPLKQ